MVTDKANLHALAAVTASVYLGQGVVAPLLADIAKEFRIQSTLALGLILSVFAFVRILLNVPMGLISDKYGRRPFIIAGPIIASVGLVGSGLSGSTMELLIWRGLGGAGSAIFMTAATAYLADVSTNANRARVMAVNRGALLLGVSISPAVGGLVAQWSSWRWALVTVGVASALIAPSAALRIREPHDKSPRSSQSLAGKRGRFLLANPGTFVAVSLVTAAVFLTRSGSVQTILPLLSAERLGMTSGQLGLALSLIVLIQSAMILPSSKLADSKGYRLVVTPGFGLLSIGLALFAATEAVSGFFLAAVVLALGAGFADAAPAAYAANISRPESFGFAMGINRTIGDVGFLLGPLLLGTAADISGSSTALRFNAVVLALIGLIFWIMGREPSNTDDSSG